MKTLVIAEKPSVGRDIGRVLGCRPSGQGSMEGGQYVVTWALGHLVTLADPETYDAKYKSWELNDLPIMPEKLKLVVIPQTSKQYGLVKTLLRRGDIKEIVIATDAGREGELVARWILEKAECRKPVKRLWISSVTDKAIREGFASLKDGKAYVNLYHSAQARAEADWLVGINATRCLTTKHNAQLSCGRVQTPTVALVAAREEEIRRFVPQAYYGITAQANSIRLLWQDAKSRSTRSFDRVRVAEVMTALQTQKTGTITQLTKQRKTQPAPQLYDLTELQRDASNRFGFSPKETLDIMQSLYEKHKALTYPRTDSRYISTDIVPTLPERLRACAVGSYAVMAKGLLGKQVTANAGFVNNAKVSDHHAIIPTEQRIVPAAMTDKEHKVYDLVIRRFIAVLLPLFVYEQTAIQVRIGKESFAAKGQVVVTEGWRAAYGKAYSEDEEQDDNAEAEIKSQPLPPLKQGDVLSITAVKQTEGKTKPPALFTEATLLSAMENPAKYMQNIDSILAKTLGETGGLGTVATRADIIEKLFNSFMMEKQGKSIQTTSKGRQLLKLVPEDLRSPALTGEWEQKLSAIAKGTLKKEQFLGGIRTYTQTAIREIKQGTETYKHDNITGKRCPDCNKFLLEVKGKRGMMLVCQDRECGYRQSVSLISNIRCPQCHKKTEIIGEGENKRINCVCGWREKYDRYMDKNRENMNRMDKREVEKYLHKANETATAGEGLSEMALAFANLGLGTDKKGK